MKDNFRWKIITFILILLVVLTYTSYLYRNKITTIIRKEIVGLIEKNYEIELDFSSIKIWPLNRLTLNDLKIRRDNKIIFSIPELKVYYNFIEFLDESKDFNFSSCLSSLNYIDLKGATIDISQFEEEFKNTNIENEEGKTSFLDRLKKDFNGVKINIKDTNLISEIKNYQFELKKISTELEFKENDIFLKSKTDLLINNLKIAGSKLKNISVDDLQLQMKMNKDDWELEINSSFIALKPFNNFIRNLNLIKKFNKDLIVKNIKGSIKSNLNFKGNGSDITSYSGYFNFKKSAANVSYSNFLEENKMNNLSGQVFISSKKQKLIFDKISADFAENNYKFDGHYDFGNNDINVQLDSYNFALGKLENIFEELKKYSPTGKGKLTLDLGGNIKSPEASLEFYLADGKFDGQKVNNLKTEMRYRDGLIYLDFFDVLVNEESNFIVDGIYNNQLKEYNFSFKGKKISSNLLNKYLENDGLAKLDGKLNLDFNLNGKGFSRDNLNLLGEVEMLSSNFGTMYGEWWLGRDRLIVDNAFWKLNDDYLDFSGEIDLMEKEYNLDFNGNNISLAEFKNKLSLFSESNIIDISPDMIPNISGKLTFAAQLDGKFHSPKLSANFQIKEGKYNNFEVANTKAELVFQDNIIDINELELNDNGLKINAKLKADLTKSTPYFEADLVTEKLSFDYLEQQLSNFNIDRLSNINIPLSGDLQGELDFSGNLNSAKGNGEIYSNNTVIEVGENHVSADNLSFLFKLNENDTLSIKDFEIKAGKSQMNLSGNITQNGYNLSYNGQKWDLSQFDINSPFNTIADFSGKVEGELKDPMLNGKLSLQEMNYKQINFDQAQLSYIYKNNNLKIKDAFWQLGESQFAIKGEINDIFNKAKLNLLASTEKGNIDRILNVIGLEPSFNIGYYLSGNAEINGNIDSPQAKLDFSAHGLDVEDKKIDINGIITDQFNLKLIGSNVKLNKLIDIVDADLGLKGSADFYGLLSGPLDDFRLDLTTNIEEASIKGFSVKNIKGYLVYGRGSDISIHQELSLGSEGNVALDGNIDPITEDMNLNIISKKLPLKLLEDAVNMVSRIEGVANGSFKINGTFSRPELNGKMDLKGSDLNLGLPEEFNNFSGKLKFEDNYVDLADFKGKYANADFSIDGRIYPFEQEKFWDLSIKGKNLPFEHGSFGGQFDTEGVDISGSLLEPVFVGQLLTHDFVASMPFEWPTSDEEIAFQPEFELTLKPGKDVYFRSGKNIDVLVQEGELKLIFEDEFQMEGELTSRQGVFEYYNNKFIMDTATASFRRFDGVIPNLHVSATTVVDGVKIKIRLDGPADNMIVTFTSQPDLTEKEIMTLLTQKGGLGEFIAKEDIEKNDVSELVKKEFMRILQSTFQLSFVSELESSLEDSLRLDRIEINTYELGWNDEITITAGKNITEKFYLEYTNRVSTDEIENEVSFSYPLSDKTRIEGSWLGDNNYSLSIDTMIDF